MKYINQQDYLRCFPLHWCLRAWYWHCAPQGPAAGLCSGRETWSLAWKWYWAPVRWSTGQPSGRPGPLCRPGSTPLQEAKIKAGQGEGGGGVNDFIYLIFFWSVLLLVWSGQCVREWCLTIYVIHWEAVGEVGHVCLLSERGLLQCFLWPAIIQTLQRTHTQKTWRCTYAKTTHILTLQSKHVCLLDPLSHKPARTQYKVVVGGELLGYSIGRQD